MSEPSPSIPVVPVPGLDDAIEKRKRPAQPNWNRFIKQALAAVVFGCTATLPLLSPTEDRVGVILCTWILGAGAAAGITSSGNPPKK
jgi:hypothetical protein